MPYLFTGVDRLLTSGVPCGCSLWNQLPFVSDARLNKFVFTKMYIAGNLVQLISQLIQK